MAGRYVEFLGRCLRILIIKLSYCPKLLLNSMTLKPSIIRQQKEVDEERTGLLRRPDFGVDDYDIEALRSIDNTLIEEEEERQNLQRLKQRKKSPVANTIDEEEAWLENFQSELEATVKEEDIDEENDFLSS